MVQFCLRTVLCFAMATCAAYAGDRFVKDSIALENEYVTVLRNASLEKRSGYGARVIVALADVEIQRENGKHILNRGGVEVIPAEEPFKGPAGEYFEINFKSDHPSLKEPEQWIEPGMNTMLYQNEQFRVFEERLPPGGERALHSHAQRVVVRLNDVQLTDPRFNPNGTPGSGRQVPNTVKFAEPVVHVVKNLSAIPLFNIVIEFKVPPRKGQD
jgi:hypothetical protein